MCNAIPNTASFFLVGVKYLSVAGKMFDLIQIQYGDASRVRSFLANCIKKKKMPYTTIMY